MEINRNEKGNDTVVLVRGISSRSMTPASSPKIIKLRIIRELSTCRVLEVSMNPSPD